MIIDAFTFHNENDLLELRLNILDPYVDQFVIVESRTTFSGKEKPLNFDPERFKKWEHKIKYYVNDDNYRDEEIEQARVSPNTGGDPRWMHEFLQKEQIKKALAHLKDEDIVFIGDVDEILEPMTVYFAGNNAAFMLPGIVKFKLRVYTYYLNLRSNEEFWGPIAGEWRLLKDKCLNHARTVTIPQDGVLKQSSSTVRLDSLMGWHFTSQGGIDAVKKKLTDQYNPELFNEATRYSLESRFGKIDFIGRDFKFEVDESELPTYLLENREKYKHLMKSEE